MHGKFLFTLGLGFALMAFTSCAMPALPTTTPFVQPLTGKSGALADFESTFENIYTQVNPSVVAIEVVQNRPRVPPGNPNGPGSRPGSQAPTLHGIGSGFVWDALGNIVTNNHVVSGADQISIAFSDGTVVPGKVVGADPDSDLAVVHIEASKLQLHPVQLADSTQLKVGQVAIAIGSPFGEQNTMTTGNISALGRSLPADSGSTQGPVYTIPDIIQTDAPLNPGNSGGVLLNIQGQVIGVTFALESPAGVSAGIGFAIPSVIVKKVVPALITTGHYEHPYLGIGAVSLNPSLAQAMNLNADQRGAMVIDVMPNSPAAKAGLRGSTEQKIVEGESVQVGGDIIIAIDGQLVKSSADLIAYLARSTQVNQPATLTLIRGGKEQTLQVTIAARPSS